MELPYAKVNFVFITSYYDIPLEGTCLYKGKLHRFEVVDYEEMIYNIHELNWLQRMISTAGKKLFEFCVSTYWSRDLSGAEVIAYEEKETTDRTGWLAFCLIFTTL